MIDDVDAKRENRWLASTSEYGFVGNSYLHDNDQNKGQCSVRFEVPIKKAGKYEVRLAYTANPNRATNVPVTIASASGTARKTVNQRKSPAINGTWISLGTYEFPAGGNVVIVVSNNGTDGYVIADAVQVPSVAKNIGKK